MAKRLYVLALGLIIIGVFASASLDWLRSLSRTIVGPVAPVTHGVTKTRDFFESLGQIVHLQQSNAELQARAAELASQLAVLQEQVDRGERVRTEMREVPWLDPDQLVAADVVARSPARTLDEIVINKGASDRVQSGQPVVKHGHLIGIVRSVDSHASTVTLLTSSQTTIPVVLAQSRGQGLLRGGLQGLVVSDLPIDVEMNPGEMVLTSALGGLIVPDIPVGQTGGVVSQESEILKRVTLVSPVTFSTLEELLVVVKPKEDQ